MLDGYGNPIINTAKLGLQDLVVTDLEHIDDLRTSSNLCGSFRYSCGVELRRAFSIILPHFL